MHVGGSLLLRDEKRELVAARFGRKPAAGGGWHRTHARLRVRSPWLTCKGIGAAHSGASTLVSPSVRRSQLSRVRRTLSPGGSGSRWPRGPRTRPAFYASRRSKTDPA